MLSEKCPFRETFAERPATVRPAYLEYERPAGADAHAFLRSLIASDPALQIAIGKFVQMPRYDEFFPRVPGCSARAQRGLLEPLFAVVELEDFCGTPVFHVRTLRESAREVWDALTRDGGLDPLLTHFTFPSRSAVDAPPVREIAAYELYCTDDRPPADEVAHLARLPFVRALTEGGVLWANLPAVDVTGWTLDALTRDDRTRLLSCAVGHLYYCEFPDEYPCPRQLRYTL